MLACFKIIVCATGIYVPLDSDGGHEKLKNGNRSL